METVGKEGDKFIGVVIEVNDIEGMDSPLNALKEIVAKTEAEYEEKGYRLVNFLTHKEVDEELKISGSLGDEGLYILIFEKIHEAS